MQIKDLTISPQQLIGIKQNLIKKLNFYLWMKDYPEMSQKKF